jgi:hypothetical protein
MTHTTEQERANVLRALEESQSLLAAMLHEVRPAVEIQKQMLQNRDAIEAARRAPAVPVPQEPTSKQVVLGAGALLGQPENTADNRHPDWHSAVAKARSVYLAMLAAAPQPPEADMGIPISAAAPVQLPEHAAKAEGGMVVWNRRLGVPPIESKLYTEQQVRQLLAQHARAPLTENQWQKLWEEWFDGPGDAEDLIRSIERAHGIQEQST